MDSEEWQSRLGQASRSASLWRRLVQKSMLARVGLWFACAESQGHARSEDAADVKLDGVTGPDSDAAVEILDGAGVIDGQCSDNPSDLMDALALSLGSSFCSRTSSSQPEGYISFDSGGRVSYTSGYRVPILENTGITPPHHPTGRVRAAYGVRPPRGRPHLAR